MRTHGYEQNFGKVSRLYPTDQDGGRVFFKLKGVKTAMLPGTGYYFIPKRHVNYRALVDLLYMAAKGKYTVKVSTKKALVDGFAEVSYLVVDF